jgi:hypothetical protein
MQQDVQDSQYEPQDHLIPRDYNPGHKIRAINDLFQPHNCIFSSLFKGCPVFLQRGQ